MPTPLKHSKNMKKHLTKRERESRQAAESGLQGRRRIYLRAPEWLSKEARVVFEATKRRLKGFELLEPIDIDLLALYADAVCRYQTAIETLTPLSNVREIQAVQAWSRMALTYADKLGFSQTARARLARRKAVEEPMDEMEKLLNGVESYVNRDLQDDGR